MRNAADLGLTEEQLGTLNRLATLITPATESFPSADEADPDREVLSVALGHFARSRLQILQYLDRVEDESRASTIESLEARDPRGFGVVCDLLVGRYLSCRPVWKVLGYPGRVRALPTKGEAEFFLRDGLLDPVVARGPIFTVPPS
jgi:hypothetical protein